jgi:hypothetical protein
MRLHLLEWAATTGTDPKSLLVVQRCPKCNNPRDITDPIKDWRRIKRNAGRPGFATSGRHRGSSAT